MYWTNLLNFVTRWTNAEAIPVKTEPFAWIWCPTTRAAAVRAGWVNYAKSRWMNVFPILAAMAPLATTWWVPSAASARQGSTGSSARTTSTSVLSGRALPAPPASTCWPPSSACVRPEGSGGRATAASSRISYSTSPVPGGWITSPGRKDSGSVNWPSSHFASGCKPPIRSPPHFKST